MLCNLTMKLLHRKLPCGYKYTEFFGGGLNWELWVMHQTFPVSSTHPSETRAPNQYIMQTHIDSSFISTCLSREFRKEKKSCVPCQEIVLKTARYACLISRVVRVTEVMFAFKAATAGYLHAHTLTTIDHIFFLVERDEKNCNN